MVHEPGDDEDDELTIDLVLESADGDEYVLVLVEHQPWDEPGVIDRLAERINLCVAYAVEGDLVEAFPNAAGRPVRVHVDHLVPLDTDVEAFFLRVADALPRHGLSFSAELLQGPGVP